MAVLLLLWVLNAVSLLVVAWLVPGITLGGFGSALVAALILGLLNTLIKPLLIVLTLPITMVTLGLFLLVVNALVFWFAGSILQGFHVDGFGWAFLGALVYSLVSAVLIGMLA